LTVTRLGVGLAPIGGLYEAVSQEQGLATVNRAYEHGLRLFDTAPLYGYGLSEQRTGLALQALPRDEFVVSTKVGRLLVPGGEGGQDIWPGAPKGVAPRFDFSYDGVMRSLEESLARLGLDRVDLLHLHDPDEHYGQALDGGFKALAELRGAGVIAAVGAGMNQSQMLARFARAADFDCFLLAGRITLLDRSGLDEFLPLCQERGIAVIAAGVFQSGLLADPRPGVTDNYSPVNPARLAEALRLKELCASFGVPLRAAAIQFPLRFGVTSVLAGVRSPAEVDDAVAMANYLVPQELWAALGA
jgi:D-threo-aldose 1-dehydrogenase